MVFLDCSGPNDINCNVGGIMTCLRNAKCNGMQEQCDGNLDEMGCSKLGERGKGRRRQGERGGRMMMQEARSKSKDRV